jgi:hypothetical protein
MHTCESVNQTNREIIGYSNPVLPGLSLSQTIVKFPEFNNQSMGLGHILPMGIQNDWKNQMVAKNHYELVETHKPVVYIICIIIWFHICEVFSENAFPATTSSIYPYGSSLLRRSLLTYDRLVLL